MEIENKKAFIILGIVIVILTTITIVVGKICTKVEVEPKNLKVDKNISRKIDLIVEGSSEEANEEQINNMKE